MRRLLVLLVLATAVPAAGQALSDSSLPLGWLLEMRSARLDAMGSAFTGLADDPSAVFCNPAGLGLLGNDQALVSHRQGLSDVNIESVVLAHRAFGGHFAYSVLYHHAPDLSEIRSGVKTGRTLNWQDAAGLISYGRNVWRWIYAGATVRFCHAVELGRTKQAFSADLAALFRYDELDEFLPDFNFASLGFTVQNLFPAFDYPHRPASLDLKFKTGLAVRYLNRMTLTFDFESTKDRGSGLNAGYEFFPFYFLALRAGYAFLDPSSSLIDRFSFGVGLGNRISGGTLSLETSLRYRQAAGAVCEMAVNWVFNSPTYYISLKERLRNEQEKADQLRQKEEPPEPAPAPEPEVQPEQESPPPSDQPQENQEPEQPEDGQ